MCPSKNLKSGLWIPSHICQLGHVFYNLNRRNQFLLVEIRHIANISQTNQISAPSYNL